jgi:tetratricopeptide (TPR) repeat protein
VRPLLLLLAASVAITSLPQPGAPVLYRWIQAAQSHVPGTIDQPLRDTASESAANLYLVAQKIGSVRFKEPEDRNDVLRRGIVLHTDIALLLPEEAAHFTIGELPEKTFFITDNGKVVSIREDVEDSLVLAQDGEYRSMSVDTAHWWMARVLVRRITPRPAGDPFVGEWYRAVCATFQSAYLLGSANYHLQAGLKVLQHDPVLLLYAGALHEVMASARVQSVPFSHPVPGWNVSPPSPESEWRQAERRLREAIGERGPLEASVRLGHVLVRLARYEEAVAVLERAAPDLVEQRLQYLCALFLGTAEGALGHREQAQRALEGATRLFPSAQSALMALADVSWRAGNRPAALDALRRLRGLPADRRTREDPWTDYYRSFAADADTQLSAVRVAAATRERR